MSSETPRIDLVDELIATLDANHEVALPFVWRQMVNLARSMQSENWVFREQLDSISRDLSFYKDAWNNSETEKMKEIDKRIFLERELAQAKKDASLWRHVRQWLHINSEGYLCLNGNSLYIGPKDNIAKTGDKMEAAILDAIADEAVFEAAMQAQGKEEG